MTNKYDIATAMSSIMASPRHQAVFAKPQPQFTKTAADKSKSDSAVKDCVDYCKKEMKDAGCGGSVKASGDKCVISCPDAKVTKKCKAYCKKKGVECEAKEPKAKESKAPKAKESKQSKASRYHTCVMGLAKISEYLDDAGLSKEATYALLALDGLVRNAMPSGDDGDCGMAKDKKKGKKGKLPAFLDKDKDGEVDDKFKSKKNDKDEDDEDEEEDDEDEDDCGSDMMDADDYDSDDIKVAPAPKEYTPGLETYLQGLGFEHGLEPPVEDSDLSGIAQNWAAELDEEDLHPDNSPMARMMRERDLRSRMDDDMEGASDEDEDPGEDPGSFMMEGEEGDEPDIMGMIDDTLGDWEPPVVGTRAIAKKKLTSLQKVALELRKARRGVRPF
jgi:hypothetical protein